MTKVRNFTLPIFAVNRPVTISMVFISLIVLGFISLKRIPLEMMPQGFSSTSMTISTPYPNSSVDEIIKKIVIPLEKEIKTISGITNFYSRINENRARTRIKFSGTQNLDELYPILKERLDRILPEMPDDFEKFYIYKRNDDSSPIAWLSLSLENYSEEQLSSLLERIEAGFSRIKGVAKVNIFGVSEKQVIIQFNQKKIMNYRISIEKVIQDLQKDNFNLASGKITDSKKEWYLKSVATFQSKKELEDRKIGYGDLKLKDIAEVKYTYPERLWRNLLDGKRAMTIAVYRESGANTIEVSERLQLYTASIAKNPQMKNIKFIFLMLQSKFIKDGLSNLLETAGWGAIFAFITLFFFLRRIRLTIIIITAVPFSILMTLIFMDFMGRSINIISLMGFMVGVGMLVDNSVVVVENIARLQMEGLEKKDAVIQGTSEVSISIILSTLTTVVVFLPAMFLGDGGQLRFIMIHLGVPIVVSLVASLFVAMLFIPFGSIFLIKKKQEQEPQYILWLQKHYYSILKWSLNHKYQTFWLLLLIIALTIIPAKNLKMSAFGSGNIVSVSTWFQFPPDWDTADVSKYFSQIEKVVHAQRKKLGIKNSYVWHSNRRGRLRLFLVDKEQQPIPPKQLLKKLKTLIPVVAGVTFRIQGRGTQDDNQGLEIQIYGSDQNQLKILAQQMIEHLETLSGVSELSESTETLDQEAVIHIDVEKAKNLGLTPQAIARQISFTIRGISNLPSINLQGKEIKMVAQLRKEDREGLETLRTMTFFSEKKEAIKLFNFARISFRNAQGEVTRRNGKSSITVTGKFTTDNIKEIEEKIKIKVRNFPLPVGYSIGTGETFEKVRSDQKSSLIAFVLSIVLIYLIMGVLFESFILPFSILISIPLAFIGTIWLLFLTETSIGTMAFIGMIVLTGVVVNNAIVLVDAINLYRKQGMEMVPAILLASKNRLRPILMTSMTTIFGLVPMALGTANIAGVPYAPLGRTVAGGLASSMLLTLFIVPLFYILFENLGDTLKRLFSRN